MPGAVAPGGGGNPGGVPGGEGLFEPPGAVGFVGNVGSVGVLPGVVPGGVVPGGLPPAGGVAWARAAMLRHSPQIAARVVVFMSGVLFMRISLLAPLVSETSRAPRGRVGRRPRPAHARCYACDLSGPRAAPGHRL